MDTQFIKSNADDRSIFVRQWPVEGAKASVQIIHGISEHSGRYDHVAAALNNAGYSVFSHDHRSFGLSRDEGKAEFDILGHFADQDGWEKAQLDILQVQALRALESKPCYLLAHSMGSFLAQSLMQRSDLPYAGVALSGTRGPVVFKDRLALHLAKFERWRVGARNSSKVADWFMEKEFNSPFKPTCTPYDWICSDPSVVEAYVSDPHCGGTFSTQLACDIAQGLVDIYAKGFAETDRNLPIYLFSGQQDAVSQMGKSVDALESYLTKKQFQNVNKKLYAGLRHEVLNEKPEHHVLEDLIDWLNSPLGACRSS